MKRRKKISMFNKRRVRNQNRVTNVHDHLCL